MRFKTFYFIVAAATVLSLSFILDSCGKRSMEGMVIVTQVRDLNVNPNLLTGESWRFIEGSQLYAIDPKVKSSSPLLLSGKFFSACSPSVSFDGKNLLFSGQEKQGEPWQIWEMELGSGKTRQITTGKESSFDPAYLPGEKIVFSRTMKNDSLKSSHTLFTCKTDGSGLTRITYNPHSYFASSVLADGRLLSISRQVFPETGKSLLMVMRPDGTKCELFYESGDRSDIITRASETADGRIVFVESDTLQKDHRRLVSVKYNRPLHSHTDLSASLSGDLWSASPDPTGKLLVSFKPKGSSKYGLYNFDPEKQALGEAVWMSGDANVLEAVIVKAHERPRKLPSEVDNGVKTGLLFCQNIEITGLTSPENMFLGKGADRIEIIGVDSTLGVVEVAEDGSFYLKMTANMPFRIRTMDASGKTVSGPGSWIWIRPNERRGCTGCHEDQEMVPANRVAMAVKLNPVAVPVHVSGVKEKKVELE
jgi:hypothetical protein